MRKVLKYYKMRINCLITAFLLFFLPQLTFTQDAIKNRQAFELFKEGVHHFNRKEYEASVHMFRKTLGMVPQDNRVRYFLAMAYYKAGFDENAIFELNTILNNGGEEDIISNLIRYIGSKKFILEGIKKSDNYSPGFTLEVNKIERYVLSRITGIAVDQTGNIYVAGFGSKVAVKFSPQGNPVLAFTSPQVQHGRVYDIALGSERRVYISDFSTDRVYIYLDDGKYIDSIGESGSREGNFYGPTSLTVDDEGNLYVIDSGNVRIQKFSPQGKFIMSFGKMGQKDGELKHPSGIAVDSSGNIYVSDHSKKIIYVYDLYGNYISPLEGVDLEDPYGLHITPDSRLIVSDRTKIYSYNIVHSTWSELITSESFQRILDVAVDRLGQVYACDFETDKIAQFVPREDKYRNLTTILDRVDADDFPAISYYVSVLDADGFPLYGLSGENFTLKIGGGRVEKIDLSYNQVRDSRLRILFLVQKSSSMEKLMGEVEHYIRQFLARLSPEDESAVFSFNQESWIASSFTSSKLRTLDAIIEPEFNEGKKFDVGLRRSIDYLNREFYKKALVVITDGSLNHESFKSFSYNSCISYAVNNYIPVYFLSFREKENELLELFARSTGGKFFDVLRSREYPYLYQTIQGYRTPQYLVFFNDVYNPDLKNLFVEAEVEVEYNTRYGKSKLGFIYP